MLTPTISPSSIIRSMPASVLTSVGVNTACLAKNVSVAVPFELIPSLCVGGIKPVVPDITTV